MQRSNTSIIGEAPEFETLLRAARVVAATDVTVLILGESGTGKELLAQEVHSASRRADRPFISINCAALPEGLAESELFGHRKGAFTGAIEHSSGRIGAAEGGTLFLDEIGELPLALQAKLLRFIESGECQRVGDPTPRRVNVRVIAATHRNLEERVVAGEFRQDLFYRLNVVPLELPALRERRSDIPLLLQTLTTRLAEQHRLTAPSFSRRAMGVLMGYSWPGNVRELRNFCERMVVLLPGCNIEPENLPANFRQPPARHAGGPFQLPDDGISLEALEREMIRQALERTSGNRSRAARLLGLTRDTLLYRLKKHAID